MRILLANKYFHPAGGPETLLFDSMEKLESLGHTVVPFSMQHPKNVKSECEKYFVSKVDYDNYSKLPWDMAKTAINFIFNSEAKKKMEQLIIDTEPDIAHLHNIYHQISPSILIPLKKHNIPVIMTLHDFKLVCPNYTFLRQELTCEECQGKHFYKAIKYRCVKNSYLKSAVSAAEMYLHKLWGIYEKNVDCFMVLSRFSQGRFVQYGVPKDKMVFLPPPVDTVKLKPQGGFKNRDYILFFGRLSERNGIKVLAQAMKHIPGIHLKIAGAGELESFLQGYISTEKLKNVSLLGFLSREDLQKEIKEAYFTVFPNLCYHLCPSSILESFAYAKPVIGGRVGSVPELVEDGKTGLLFEPGNEKDLAGKIKYLYENPKLVEKMGQNARAKVVESYSAEKYYPKLLEIYEDLIEKKKVGKNVRRQINLDTFNKLSLREGRSPTKQSVNKTEIATSASRPSASPRGERDFAMTMGKTRLILPPKGGVTMTENMNWWRR